MRVRQEDGAVLVITVAAMVVMLLICALVLDVGRFMQHKRALQVQADAAALAAAGDFKYPCDDTAIIDRARDYGARNALVDVPAGRLALLVNSATYDGQASPTDSDLRPGGPCASASVDVKVTEHNAPWLFRAANLDHINAHARVEILRVTRQSGLLPVAVPDIAPKRMAASFVDEATGTVLATTELKSGAFSNGVTVWDNAATPLSLGVTAERIGVRVAVSGSTASVSCGAALVECYDLGSANGLAYVRGWTSVADAAHPTAPIAKDVTLVPGTCADAYFSVSTTSCSVGVRATVTFAVAPTTIGAKVTATVNGTDYPLTYNATSQTWSSGTVIPVAAAAGPLPVTLSWEQTTGTFESQTCSTSKTQNPCKGSFGVVQRTFAGSDDRSGPLRGLTLSENGVAGANSFERCSSLQSSCTHTLVVRVGIVGSLSDAQSVGDPAVALRVVGGSQNQSLDCDPALSKLADELALGCSPTYQLNGGTTCPGGASALWSSPQPWACVAISTGTTRNQVAQGLNRRILGSDKPASCTSPNRWSTFPDLDPSDPRIVSLMTTPYGTFTGSGGTTFPVTGFATFYVTGWASQGGGFTNPCQGNGDDPVTDSGVVVGHFVKYVIRLNQGGGGTDPCDSASFGTCVAVLTK